MNERDLQLEEYGIGFWEYRELLAFCRQYPQKIAEANSLIRTASPEITGMPRASGVGDRVARTVIQRERLTRDVSLIDRCAARAGDGHWQRAIIQNVCYGRKYEQLDPGILRSSRRNDFYRARREFFYLLSEAKKNPEE